MAKTRTIVNGEIEERESVVDRGSRYIESVIKERDADLIIVITYSLDEARQERKKLASSLTDAQRRKTVVDAEILSIRNDLADLDAAIAKL